MNRFRSLPRLALALGSAGGRLAILALGVSACSASKGADDATTFGPAEASVPTEDEGDASVTVDVPPATDAVYDVAPVSGPVPLEHAAHDFAEIVCEKAYTCCTPAERASNQLITSQAGCTAYVDSWTAAVILPEARAAMARGRATYDPTALATCLARYQEASCTDARAIDAVSALRMCPFIHPLVPVGGACDQDLECDGGFCTAHATSADGTCIALQPDGLPCSADGQCQSGRCMPGVVVCGPAAELGLCEVL